MLPNEHLAPALRGLGNGHRCSPGQGSCLQSLTLESPLQPPNPAGHAGLLSLSFQRCLLLGRLKVESQENVKSSPSSPHQPGTCSVPGSTTRVTAKVFGLRFKHHNCPQVCLASSASALLLLLIQYSLVTFPVLPGTSKTFSNHLDFC